MRSQIWDPDSFYPGSGMEKFGSGINIPDPQHWYLHLQFVSSKFLHVRRSPGKAIYSSSTSSSSSAHSSASEKSKRLKKVSFVCFNLLLYKRVEFCSTSTVLWIRCTYLPSNSNEGGSLLTNPKIHIAGLKCSDRKLVHENVTGTLMDFSATF